MTSEKNSAGRSVDVSEAFRAEIDGYRLWLVRVPFKSTMRSSRGALEVGEKVILELRTAGGLTGLGESSVIFPGRSGETAGTIFSVLRELFCPRLLGRNPLHLERILESLEPLASEQYAFLATKCAIDLALHDLKARTLGISVADLLGGASRLRLPLSRSISVMPDPELVATAQALSAKGYRLLTLKGTADWKANIHTFRQVREALPSQVELEIDPNQAWKVKEALAVDEALAGLGLYCLEQPCAWWDFEGLRTITRRARASIAADESVLSPADVLRLIRMEAADLVTLKLAKSGGIRSSALMLEAASAAGLGCNMGSKHPLGVGAAALLHFAAAHPGVGEFIGYGSALERFVGDVIQEEIQIDSGEAVLPAGVGFGVSLDEEALRRFQLASYESGRA